MKLGLSQYPAAIAQAAQAVNELEHQIGEARQHLARLEGNADMVVAFEANLEYQQAMDTLLRLTTEKSNALAHLEHLRNEFSVAKLEARLAIAQQLTGLETREFVGL